MSKKRLVFGIAALLILCCAGSILIAVLSPKTTETPVAKLLDTPEQEVSRATPSAPTPENTATPAATNTPKPTLSPEDRLKAAVKSALRTGNRDVPRLQSVSIQGGTVQVAWAINDNLSTNWIVSGARMDAVDVLEAISESDIPYEQVHLVGTFSMKDVYGNVEETPVVNVTYLKTTLDKINWQNFDSDNVFLLADVVAFLHPEFSQ